MIRVSAGTQPPLTFALGLDGIQPYRLVPDASTQLLMQQYSDL